MTPVIEQLLSRPAMWPNAVKLATARILHRRQVRLRADGMVLETGTGAGQGAWCALAGLDYEAELRPWLSQIRDGDVVLDIGANIGAYTVRAARRAGRSGTVVAIEAMAANAQRLQRNVIANGLTNVRIAQVAIGQEEGHIAISTTAGRLSSATICRHGTGEASEVVQMTTVDLLVKQLDLKRVDWVKMDIEGAEPQALAGMSQTIDRWYPGILFENADAGAVTRGLLRAFGYQIGRLTDDREWVETEVGQNLFARHPA